LALHIGILGAGHMGRTHSRILAADSRVAIVGVADAMPERAQALAAEVGGTVYPTLDALLEAGLDALYITTPNTQHTAAALTALAAGVHVFSEKPMATSLPEAQQIAEAARASTALYQVGHNRRFAPVYKQAKAAVQGGLVPSSANIKMNRGELQEPPWVANRAITGGFLYESTIHLLDMARWLMGEVEEVYCRASTCVYAEPDNWSALLTFAGGRTATFSSCAHAAWTFPFERIELFGAHANLVTEEMERVLHTPGLATATIIHDYSRLPFAERWGYAEEDRLFVDAILTGGKPPVTAQDGLAAVALVDALYRSAQTGQPYRL